MSLFCAKCFLLGSLGMLVPAAGLAGQGATTIPQVVVLAFEFASPSDSALVRLADRCATRLVAALRAAKIMATRPQHSSLEGLREARAATFAVQGVLTRTDGQYSAELRLLDVQTGDELRSYMYGPGDEGGIVGLAEAAAPRIATVVREALPPAR